jgi:hypothetical protein
MTEQRCPAELAAEGSSEDTRSFVRRVKRATRRKYTPEEKVGIVLEGFRGEIGISALCRRARIAWAIGLVGADENVLCALAVEIAGRQGLAHLVGDLDAEDVGNRHVRGHIDYGKRAGNAGLPGRRQHRRAESQGEDARLLLIPVIVQPHEEHDQTAHNRSSCIHF